MEAKRQVEKFFSRYPSRKIRKGQIIVYGGDEPGHVFYVVSGVIRQYDISDRGVEVVVNLFKAPAFFPMSWAINRRPNPYFFEADSDVVMRIAPPDDVVRFLKQHSEVMFDLISRLYSGVDGLQRRMAHLMGGSAKTRLLFEIVTECRRFGRSKDDRAIELSVTELGLAERTGLSRETVSREIGKLKQAGLITHEGKVLVVLDFASINDMLGDKL